MHIAICDDDSSEIKQIMELLLAYNKERNCSNTFKTYINTIELVDDIKGGGCDLILLDIIMPGFSGMQAAQEIREFDSLVQIVFLTSSPEFAVESYAVKAHNYLLKPVLKETLFAAIDLILEQMAHQLSGFPVKTRTGAVRILYSKLVFVEVISKRLHFYSSDGTNREVFASLAEYEQILLSQKEFVKVHRSYIVNLNQMAEIAPNEFIAYTGKTIPISRLLFARVREVYVKHLFAKREW